MKRYLKIDSIESFETDELDFSLHTDFKIGDEDDYEFFDNSILDGEPIEINHLKNIIQRLENNGANYLKINQYLDHHSYFFEGLKIYEPSKEESNEEKKKNLEAHIKYFIKKREDYYNTEIVGWDRKIKRLKEELEKI